MLRKMLFAVLVLLVVVALTSCEAPEATEEPTEAPTEVPTDTPEPPTATPEPTGTTATALLAPGLVGRAVVPRVVVRYYNEGCWQVIVPLPLAKELGLTYGGCPSSPRCEEPVVGHVWYSPDPAAFYYVECAEVKGCPGAMDGVLFYTGHCPNSAAH